MSTLRVLLSAFSCEPNRGSEPEVGYRTMLAAADQHEVWVITSATGVPAIERSLAEHPLRERIHLVAHPAVPPGEDEGNLGLYRFHRVYDAWQRRIARIAIDLERKVRFDLVHHATIATTWTRAGVAVVDKPLVWGPVGGGVKPPPLLAPVLGLRGSAEDLARVVGRVVLARMPHARLAPDHASVVLAQNALTAGTIRTEAPVTVLSNSTAVDVGNVRMPDRRSADFVFVGRLVAWKGAMLALRAFRYVDHTHTHARLRFFGTGSDEARLLRAAGRWGLSGRITLEGRVSRDRMLRELAGAAALVHPSLHDEAALAVAEALSLGTPAICLDHGGPAEIVRQWPEGSGHLVPPGPPDRTARRIATAVNFCLEAPAPVRARPLAPERAFAARILGAYSAALESGRGGPSSPGRESAPPATHW